MHNNNTRQHENNNRSEAFSPSAPRRITRETHETQRCGTWEGGCGDGGGAVEIHKTSKTLERGEAGLPLLPPSSPKNNATAVNKTVT